MDFDEFEEVLFGGSGTEAEDQGKRQQEIEKKTRLPHQRTAFLFSPEMKNTRSSQPKERRG